MQNNIQFTESRYTTWFGLLSICFKQLSFQNNSSVGTRPEKRMALRLMTTGIFFFKEIKIVNILMKTFLGLTLLLSALFYASKQ